MQGLFQLGVDFGSKRIVIIRSPHCYAIKLSNFISKNQKQKKIQEGHDGLMHVYIAHLKNLMN